MCSSVVRTPAAHPSLQATATVLHGKAGAYCQPASTPSLPSANCTPTAPELLQPSSSTLSTLQPSSPTPPQPQSNLQAPTVALHPALLAPAVPLRCCPATPSPHLQACVVQPLLHQQPCERVHHHHIDLRPTLGLHDIAGRQVLGRKVALAAPPLAQLAQVAAEVGAA